MNGILSLNLEKILIISIGALLGANARYWIGDFISQRWGTTFPFGTFLINISGSLLIGLFISLTSERILVDPRWRLLFIVGFLGSYTTFSSFMFESLNLIERGQWFLGLLNIFGSILVGLISVGIGMMIGRFL